MKVFALLDIKITSKSIVPCFSRNKMSKQTKKDTRTATLTSSKGHTQLAIQAHPQPCGAPFTSQFGLRKHLCRQHPRKRGAHAYSPCHSKDTMENGRMQIRYDIIWQLLQVSLKANTLPHSGSPLHHRKRYFCSDSRNKGRFLWKYQKVVSKNQKTSGSSSFRRYICEINYDLLNHNH